MEKEKPVGVFDSGIGGLTVVKRIASVLPNESIVYFGDTARVPYGSKSNETVIEYSIQNAKLLLKKNVKAIVVACNTASSVAIPVLRDMFSVPVIGMIEPGSKMALRATRNGHVGIIGTRATVSNRAYSREIHQHNKDIKVIEQACPLFVPLAEEGWHESDAAALIAKAYLSPLREEHIDTLVLGCTHYPLLANVIQRTIGEEVLLIDSGIAAAEIVREELDRIGLMSNSNAMGRMDFYVSDIPSTFAKVAALFLEREIKQVTKVDLDYLQSLHG
jgi:glutamate racemase